MMDTQASVEIAGYRLPVVIERVNGSYQATSPALDGFLVLADTLDEVLALAPGVARALLEAMQAKGMTPPLPIEVVDLVAQSDRHLGIDDVLCTLQGELASSKDGDHLGSLPDPDSYLVVIDSS
jgi:predicted RNase H-like HicB family nuclease